jgi:hypothetical protein
MTEESGWAPEPIWASKIKAEFTNREIRNVLTIKLRYRRRGIYKVFEEKINYCKVVISKP